MANSHDANDFPLTVCLKCRIPFYPDRPFNKICPRCTKQNDYLGRAAHTLLPTPEPSGKHVSE